MDELNVHLRSISRLIIFFLSICLIAWVLLPMARALIAGFALGALSGWINAYYLSRKVKDIADLAASGVTRRIHYGFMTRAAVLLLAAFVAVRVPGINVYAMVAGYLFVQLAMLLLGYVRHSRGKG